MTKISKLEATIRQQAAELEALWAAMNVVDTSDPQLAEYACKRFGLDLDRAALKKEKGDG